MPIELLSTIVVASGALILGVLNWIVSRRKVNRDEEALLRAELWTEVHALRQRVIDMQIEIDDWRAKFYALQGKYDLQQTVIDRLRPLT